MLICSSASGDAGSMTRKVAEANERARPPDGTQSTEPLGDQWRRSLTAATAPRYADDESADGLELPGQERNASVRGNDEHVIEERDVDALDPMRRWRTVHLHPIRR